ncbi:protein mono-ADP-ribosyltransferase PARP14-like isoform X1 [Octopus sinensis]|uniref:Poly [ADP-ribose] polymerase n=1 Tax=Octopus sinensis TaxID=2607531 RepID=A0A6P7S6T1_9MOLL|nr:protein mono-ADP-ribosyltransferase PARP14-like isoform X1 [Octopus sinensis]
MEIFIENLRKDISSKEENFKMFGFQEFLKSGEGNTFLCEMQKKSESIILNSNLGSETEEILNFVYKNCEIVLKEGDITTLDTDAIVNAANGRLDHIDGVAAAIVKKGGSEIQAESNDIMEQRKNELEPGEVVSTKAGKLKCKTIIHAVGPVSNYGGTWEMFYLGIAVENCLVFLDLNSYISIAIPAINTGIYGIPIEEGTKCIVTTIKIYLDTHTNSKIKHICLIDVRKKVVSAFKRHLEMVFGISKSRGSTSSNTPFPGSQQEPSSMTPRTNVASGEYGRINIKPINDSITNAYLDVIVNSTNKILQLNDGSLSKSILNAAGPEIQYECNQKYPRGISTSTIAITKGHDLKCKNVFHLTLPEWDENSSDSILANLTQIITTCLENAEELGAKSLAFPILGAGALNYPIENLPETMYEAVKSYSNQNPSQIKDVYFVFKPEDTEIVKKLKEYFQENTTGSSAASSGTTLSNNSRHHPQHPRTKMISTHVGDIKIQLIFESISNVYVDVVVNSSNKELQLNRGSVSKLLLKAAGPQIQDECNQKYPQGISTSEIAITKGHDLKCKNVFHLVLPDWNEKNPDSILANLTQIMTICLENAERMGAKSLAFPILGAGALNYPIENLPETMFEAVKSYSNQNPSQIKDVYFVVYPKDTEIVKKFKEYFQEISADGSDDSDGSDGSHGSDVSSDHEDEEIDDNVSAGQQEDSVTLKFITNYRNLNHAIKTVGKEYNSQLTTKEIPFDMELKGFRKPNLKSIGTDHEVQISIRDKIKIHGRYSHVKNAKLDVQSLLLEYKEADEEILFKDIVQWSYFDENNPENIRMFSDKENAKLEKANSQKKKSLDWNNRRYDFQKMSFQHGGKNYKMKRKNLMDEAIPNTWSPMGDNELLKSVQITNGQEYDDIQAIFSQYLPSYHITKIERIQNKALYHGYQVLKRKYELENPNISNEVDSLWHGTAGGSIDGINKSGFNRSYCGKNATAFGEGVYFARDIQYSAQDKYSAPDANNTKRIYLCSVLVGKMMKGSHGLKVLQDSCNSAVDDIQNPTIYVIFHDNQAYPKYLIEFAQ